MKNDLINNYLVISVKCNNFMQTKLTSDYYPKVL